MASTRQLKSRIRSVRSNKQITKAMELVATSKLRSAQEATRASSDYSESSRELLTRLSELTDVKRNIFFAKREVKTRLVILITSDRGLAGAFNANAIKQFVTMLEEDHRRGIHTQLLAVGRRGAQFGAKIRGLDIIAAYSGLPDRLTAADIRPILVAAVDAFIDKRADSVEVVTTRFVNSMTQTALSFNLLPAGFETTDVESTVAHSIFEPSVEEVLEGATIRLLESQLYQAILDARASEHSMRRAAMKNATDNAMELIDDLTLEMNKVRQASITQELSEISGGVEAMK